MPIDADKFMEGMPVVEDVVPEPYGVDQKDVAPVVEAPAAETPAVVPPAAAQPQPKSFVEGVEKASQEPEKMVPLHVLIEERRRRQAAESRLAQSDTPEPARVNAENPAATPIDALPDDEIVTAGQVKQTMAQIIAREREAAAVQRSVAEFNARAIADEQAVRAQVPEYDQIMEVATALNLIGPADRAMSRQSATPMRFLFETASKRIAATRAVLAPQSAVAETPKQKGTPVAPELNQENILNDDEFFDKQFPGAHSGAT